MSVLAPSIPSWTFLGLEFEAGNGGDDLLVFSSIVLEVLLELFTHSGHGVNLVLDGICLVTEPVVQIHDAEGARDLIFEGENVG